jgi:Putative Actinobacterial Holin-X, holin superfamily III
MTSRPDRSIPELFGDALSQLAKLIGNEFDLAKAELTEKAGQMGRGATIIGVGAAILIPALELLLFAAASALIEAGLSNPMAYLLTGGIALAVAASLVAIGFNRMSVDASRPSMTISQLKRDQAAAKEMAR